MAYEGGFTSALNDISRRRYEDSQTAINVEELQQFQRREQQQQQEDAAAFQYLQNVMQPSMPSPGQASVPMMPSPPPSPGLGAPIPGVTPPSPFGPPNAAPTGLGTPTGMPPAPPGAPPAPTAPPTWQGPSPSAPPSLGGPAGGGGSPAGASPVAGATPPAGLPTPMTPPFIGAPPPMPGGAVAGGASPEPMPGTEKINPVPVDQIWKQIDSNPRLSGQQKLRVMQKVVAFANQQNDALMRTIAEKAYIQSEAAKAANQAALAIRNARDPQRKPTEIESIAERLKDPNLDAQTRKLLSDRARKLNQLTGKGAGAGAGGSTAGPGPKMPEPGSPDDIALDAVAWKYIKTGVLPYRKGGGGGKDKNEQVLHRVGEIAQQFNMSGEDLVNQSAEFKADAQSLAFQTKKLDAIEGTLSSFHNNIQTWDSIAAGKAPALNPEGFKALGNTFKKMDFSGIKTVNDVALRIKQEFNDPTTAAYLTAAMTVAMDYARIMQGPQSVASLTEGARAEAQRLISTGYDEKARKALIATLESDTQGQVKGIRDQRTKIEARMQHREPAADTKPEGPTKPKEGDVVKGYRFKGGDPSKKENWEKV